jgi:RNA polymerase sigma factor (sigma-70 family)
MRPELKVLPGGEGRELEGLSDDQLMLLLERDKRSFEVLVRRHQPLVLAYVRRFLADPSMAGDITQEVFLTVWKDRSNYSTEGRFRNYLLTLTINRCRSAGRRRQVARRQQPVIESQAAQVEAALPLDELLQAERASSVRIKLQRLEEPYREALLLRFCSGMSYQELLLRFCSGMSYQEIAAVTNKPEGTVKSLVYRGLKQLWASLPPELRA